MSPSAGYEVVPLQPVPRSKGCITCTSRKTRCDGRRPTCQACERRKQVCHGYRRGDFVFMNEGWRAPGVASPAPKPNATSEILPPPSRPLASDPRLIYVSFFLSQFTHDPPPEALIMIDNCHRYLGMLLGPPAFDRGSNPLPHAAEALVMSHFGKLNASPQTVHNSIAPYVKALKALSAKLAHFQRVGTSCIEEEEVMQLVFACLFLSFWELAMNPQGTAWQKHVRGLANIIQWRGPQGFQSPRSLQIIIIVRLFILLESVSSKQPTFLSEEKWQRFRNFHPRLLPWQPALITDDTTEPRTATGPRHYLDFIFDHLIIVSNLTAEFANGLTRNVSSNKDNTSRPMRRSMSSAISLQRIQAESLAALERLEIVLAQMMTNIGGALVNTTSHSTQKGPCWGKPLEYNLAGLCRIAAVTLRLLVCHLIEEQQQEQQQQQQQKQKQQQLVDSPEIPPYNNNPADSREGGAMLAGHRAALMAHVEAIVNMIPYSAHSNIFGVAPLCFVPAFRVAKVVLARESAALRTEGGRGSEVARCLATEALIQRHLDFVASRKIPIKVDI